MEKTWVEKGEGLEARSRESNQRGPFIFRMKIYERRYRNEPVIFPSRAFDRARFINSPAQLFSPRDI